MLQVRGYPMSNSDDLFAAIAPSADVVQSQMTSLANYQLNIGVNMQTNGRSEEAITYFKRALALDSSNVDAYNDLGTVQLQLNKNDDAIATYKKLVAMKPFDSDAATSLGNAYAQAKQWTNAADSYKKATQLDPSNTTALYSAGQAYLLNNKLNDALTTFQKLGRLKPNDPNVYYALGQTYNKIGNYDYAIDNLTKAIDLKHGTAFPQAESELGYAYAGKGDDTNLQRTITTLQGMDSTLATQLQNDTIKPKFSYGSDGSYNSFYTELGPNTSLSTLTLTDPNHTLAQANATKSFTMDFQFNTDMDVTSVQNTANWQITKANGGQAGYYNYGYTPNPGKEAASPIIQSVNYDVSNQLATVTFSLTQNATADAVIDPSHLVFSFSGTDADGKSMDPTANAYDGVNGVIGASAISFYG